MSVESDSQLGEASWDEAEQFWRREVDTIASAAGQPGQWESAWPKFFGDGVTPMPREDKPVCDGRNWTQDRAFYIWEFNRIEGEAGISAEVQDSATLYDDGGKWLDEGSPHDRVARTNLSIWLERSADTVDLARRLVALWMDPSTTVTEMKAFIESRPRIEPR
jgi:hypothetical protein